MLNLRKKYFYNSITVHMYCKMEGFNYSSVTRSIRYRILKYQKKNYDLAYIIDEVINIYTLKKKRKIVRSIILNENYPINISKTCEKLQIYRNAIYKVMKYNFNAREAIIIIYFLHDIEKQQISISKKNIKNILHELNNKTYSPELKNLFCYKYLGYDTIYDIYNELQNTFIKMVKRKTRLYFNYINNDIIQEMTNDFYIFLTNLLNDAKIISNINYQLKWASIKYSYAFVYSTLNEEKKNQNIYHLEHKLKDDYTLMDTIGFCDEYSI